MSDKKIKISIIGDGGCGKTTLMERFCLDEFSQKTVSTIGVDCMQKRMRIDDQLVTFDIYDTAGQERYRTIIKSYYRNAHGIILVFDITSRESFESLEFWSNEIKESISNPHTEIILVGTKSDLSQKREIFDDDIVQFCEENKLKYIETSSKANFNIGNLFESIGINIIRKMNNPLYAAYYQNNKFFSFGEDQSHQNNYCCLG